MKRNTLKNSKILVLSLVSLLTLSACGKNALEDPEVVVGKAKQALTEVTSGQVDVTVSMGGDNGVDDLNFNGNITLGFDKSDVENHKVDLHLDASGDMKATDKNLDGALDVNFVTLNKEYYVMLNKLESSDETVTAIQPFIALYMGKWLRIAEDFIPENIRGLQGQDEAMEFKKKQLEDLFVETQLFTVTKEYGVEKLNGSKVYHYGLGVNMDGFKNYITKAAIIDGRELTMQEVEEAVKILSYIKEAELYIDTENYYILKSVFKFNGEALAAEGANLTVEIVVEGSDFNQSVKIEAPTGAEDFNPLNLLMGLGGLPTTEVSEELGDISEDAVPAGEDVGVETEVMEEAVTSEEE